MNFTGQFARLTWESVMQTRAGVVSTITKRVEATVRIGLSQDTREAVKIARRQGNLPRSNQGLRWGVWLYFPYLIFHKGETYLRIYPVINITPKVTYYLNGQEARLEEIEQLVLASELPKEYKAWNCFYLNVKHLKSIN